MTCWVAAQLNIISRRSVLNMMCAGIGLTPEMVKLWHHQQKGRHAGHTQEDKRKEWRLWRGSVWAAAVSGFSDMRTGAGLAAGRQWVQFPPLLTANMLEILIFSNRKVNQTRNSDRAGCSYWFMYWRKVTLKDWMWFFQSGQKCNIKKRK